MHKAIRISVRGRVQGVGFRPFIYQLAKKFHITGTVQNNMDGVNIVAEGASSNLFKLLEAIRNEAPRLSRIDDVNVKKTSVSGFIDFKIIPSDREGKSSLIIPVDSSICDDCLDEMKDPNNFRFQYPFINCTQCGPRYTIISELPYDRPFTSMKEFNLCKNCKEEYNEPANRRHHAQPIACPTCGPSVTLVNLDGKKIAEQNKAIRMAQDLLREGKIGAIKGLGGYHLVCDATNEHAIVKLRERKNRPSRPLAVMVPTIAAAKRLCHISEQEEEVLKSPAAPIVLLEQKINNPTFQLLAPGLKTIGLMLPYTPLHHLLFENSHLQCLIMTSANPSGIPILYNNKHYSKIKDIADFVLTNNREILHPLDDSVVQVIDQKRCYIRRSRGYVPDPITTTQPVHNMIALGSQQKNTFAIGRTNQIFLGPHIGDVDYLEVIHFLKNEAKHLMKWLGTEPRIIAIDKHPNFKFIEIAKELAEIGGTKNNPEIVQVHHHHAHHVACMEDNQLLDPAYGIILDGTGYGDDGHIWGFEILYGNAKDYKRLAHLRYSPLPGGERAIKEPWRNAVGMLISYLGEDGKALAKRLFQDKQNEIDILSKMIEQQINSPLAGTCGRLFDAVSSMLGICTKATYDGEPAIRLSEIMPKKRFREVKKVLINTYPYKIDENIYSELEIDFSAMIRAIVLEHLELRPTIEIVEDFHHTLVKAIIETMQTLAKRNPNLNKQVVLSGGSFQNPFLLKEIKKELIIRGFNVYTHNKTPCNDGGISLGQLVIAANKQIPYGD